MAVMSRSLSNCGAAVAVAVGGVAVAVGGVAAVGAGGDVVAADAGGGHGCHASDGRSCLTELGTASRSRTPRCRPRC